MRKIFAVTAIALLALAGQAVASEGVASLSPDIGRIGFASSDDANSDNANGHDRRFAYDVFGALLLIGGTIALLTSSSRHSDSSQSA